METNYLYSPSRNGFYSQSLMEDFEALGEWPDDLLEVDIEVYEHCMNAPSRGEMVAPGSDSLPVTVAVPAPTLEEAENANIAKRDRLLALASLRIEPLRDAVDLGIATHEDKSLYDKWRHYRVLISRVDVTLVSPHWPLVPESA